MTTIAVSETEIAWDSQSTRGSIRTQVPGSKAQIIDGVVYACAGDSSACELAPEWHVNGADPRRAPRGEWVMVVRTPDKKVRVYSNDCLSGYDTGYPVTIGSGGDFAFALMWNGMSAYDAVVKACEIDIYTGPPVHSIKFADLEKQESSCSKPRKKKAKSSKPKKRKARSASTSKAAR